MKKNNPLKSVFLATLAFITKEIFFIQPNPNQTSNSFGELENTTAYPLGISRFFYLLE